MRDSRFQSVMQNYEGHTQTAMPAPVLMQLQTPLYNLSVYLVNGLSDGLLCAWKMSTHIESNRYRMSTSPWPHSCNSTLGRLATMSALRNQTNKGAHIVHTHTHTQLLTIPLWAFLGGAVYPRGEQLNTGPETGSIPPSVSLFFLRLLLSHLSPSMSFYLHSRLFSSNSLPDRGRGAALLLRAQHRCGLCRTDCTQGKGGFSSKGACCGGVTEFLHQDTDAQIHN